MIREKKEVLPEFLIDLMLKPIPLFLVWTGTSELQIVFLIHKVAGQKKQFLLSVVDIVYQIQQKTERKMESLEIGK